MAYTSNNQSINVTVWNGNGIYGIVVACSGLGLTMDNGDIMIYHLASNITSPYTLVYNGPGNSTMTVLGSVTSYDVYVNETIQCGFISCTDGNTPSSVEFPVLHFPIPWTCTMTCNNVPTSMVTCLNPSFFTPSDITIDYIYTRNIFLLSLQN